MTHRDRDAAPSDDELPGSCDWGWCGDTPVAWRWDTHGDLRWLPVCTRHQLSDLSTCPRCDGERIVPCSCGHLPHKCPFCDGKGIVPSVAPYSAERLFGPIHPQEAAR